MNGEEEYVDVCPILFQSPVTLAIFGATLSGKTMWCKRLLEQANKMFTQDVHQIIYCYGMYQPLFENLNTNLENFTLHSGLPTLKMIEDFTTDRKHTVIVLDDLQQEMCTNPVIEKLFTQLAHHLNISVIFMGNNLFQKNFSRTITVNVHVMILFKNARDSQQIRCLARQLYPKNSEEFLFAYNDCTSKPWGYLVVDLSPRADESLRLRTNIFQGEDPIIYKL